MHNNNYHTHFFGTSLFNFKMGQKRVGPCRRVYLHKRPGPGPNG